ncbi:MAG TPA: hypothetical protein VKF32_06605 [Thermoanaerobaculia bacterium]|nr:hypothetical protein [Thermoanaerobaculia bacterium]
MSIRSLFETITSASGLPFAFAFVLLLILIVSFRSRPVVFCQYLKKMTGIQLSPKDVRQVYAQKGAEGVRDLFLDLIIREDLKTSGTLQIPPEGASPAAEPETGTAT